MLTHSDAFGQQTLGQTASPAQQSLEQAAAEQKFLFLMFYKDRSPAAEAMVQTLKQGVAQRSDRAALTFARVSDPAEQALVAKYDVGRAPMPMTLCIAPNGALTAIMPKLTDADLDQAIVTPTMARCMKGIQDGKIVFVCVQTTEKPVMPNAVREFQADPLFKDRFTVVSMHAHDPAETRLLNQLQIDPRQTRSPMSVVMAPPGALIGKYNLTATKDEIAAALHQAGKCCDDENCKHNHGSHPRQPANGRRN
jgi:hypothetical protein